MSAVIEISNLRKYYGKSRGVENLTLSVMQGEIMGFIGPNGAGKSTTIRTLMALIHPTGGSVRIFGKDCIRDSADIAGDIGYLPAEPSFYENMRVREYLDYASALYGCDCSVRRRELVERLNLDEKRRISDLSTGNKKKVGIVAALQHSPKLLILDEPTSGLDPLAQQTLFDILQEEKAKGQTVLFSSHVLSEVQKICDRVAIIKEGRLLIVQNISELRRNGYKKITLTAPLEIPKDYFALTGVTNYEQKGTDATFLYKGNIPDILERLNALKPLDVFLQEPTLEEVFLHYYESGDDV